MFFLGAHVYCLAWKPQEEQGLYLSWSPPQPKSLMHMVLNTSPAKQALNKQINLQIALLRHIAGFYLEKFGAQVCAN